MSDQTELLLSAILSIEAHLKQHFYLNTDPSLFSGRAGELLFLTEFNCWRQNPDAQPELLTMLELLLNDAESVYPDLSFGGGLSGIAWLTDFVMDRIDGCLDDSFHAGFAHLLMQSLQLAESSDFAELDFVTAKTGFAPFILRRNKAGDYQQLASQLKAFYTRHAFFDPAHGPLQQNTDTVDNGIAHGFAGPLLVLCHFADDPLISALLLQYSNWLLGVLDRQERQTMQQVGRYSHLAWCNGELAHTFVLLQIGLALGSTDIISTARRHAIRLSFARPHVRDASLCHGTAGIMFIFQLLASRFPVPELINAKQYWLTATLNGFKQSGLSAFDFYNGDGHEACCGLLEGYAGVGLCLLSVLAPTTQWSQCILLTSADSVT